MTSSAETGQSPADGPLRAVAGRRTGILVTLLLLLLFPFPARAEYRKCIDEHGVKYWVDNAGDSPPAPPTDKNSLPKCQAGTAGRFQPLLPESFKYTDRNGIVFWVDQESKIPPEYRGQDQSPPEKPKPAAEPAPPPVKSKSYTRVAIRNNQILVPVTLFNQGRKVLAHLILDTGASSTIIYPALAQKLGMGRNKVAAGVSMIANGSQVTSYQATIDLIQVDESALRNPEVVIMPSVNNPGADGLLGNSFLKYFHFSIDYDNQVIVWD